MSDFDFEELDKAVSGALNGVSSPTTPEVSAAAPAELATPTVSQPVATDTTPVPVSTPTPAAQPSPVTPAARRSSGRFMDMVHPSSDMRGRSDGLTSPVPPRSTVSQPATNDTAPVSSSAMTPEMPLSTSTDAPAVEAAPESPFLPDAKVEKRPLGGTTFSDELTFDDLKLEQPETEEKDLLEAPGAMPALDAPEAEPLLDAPQAEEMIDAPDEKLLLEEVEPQGALEPTVESVAVEPTVPEVTTPEVMSEAPVVTEPAQVSAAPEHIPAAAASISQQYTEKPSSAEANGAIFDTESYHSPIPAGTSAKKKSALGVIIWIILLIIAGAGAGAAFYIYVMPML